MAKDLAALGTPGAYRKKGEEKLAAPPLIKLNKKLRILEELPHRREERLGKRLSCAWYSRGFAQKGVRKINSLLIKLNKELRILEEPQKRRRPP